MQAMMGNHSLALQPELLGTERDTSRQLFDSSRIYLVTHCVNRMLKIVRERVLI